MNDRELLELAAKAAGLVIGFSKTSPEQGRSYVWNDEKKKGRWWNPIEDDGDALRLAVKLGLNIDIEPYEAVAYYAVGKFVCETATVGYSIDAATRRAIVRAAAEMGRQMQEGGEE